MSTAAENTRTAKAIFAMLIAGIAISFAVIGYLVIADDGRDPHASSAEHAVPLVRADRGPVKLPPG